jgi:putative membrane protein
MRIIINWLVSALCIVLVAMFVPGFHVDSFITALIAAAVIGLLNATIGALLKLITLPLGILTLGIFFLVINAFMLEFASRLVTGFHVASFGAAFIGAAILAVLHMVLGGLSD